METTQEIDRAAEEQEFISHMVEYFDPSDYDLLLSEASDRDVIDGLRRGRAGEEAYEAAKATGATDREIVAYVRLHAEAYATDNLYYFDDEVFSALVGERKDEIEYSDGTTGMVYHTPYQRVYWLVDFDLMAEAFEAKSARGHRVPSPPTQTRPVLRLVSDRPYAAPSLFGKRFSAKLTLVKG